MSRKTRRSEVICNPPVVEITGGPVVTYAGTEAGPVTIPAHPWPSGETPAVYSPAPIGGTVLPPGYPLFVVGRVFARGWDFMGICLTEAEAVAHCKDKSYFVGPVRVGLLAKEGEPWDGVYFPHRPDVGIFRAGHWTGLKDPGEVTHGQG